MVVVVADGGTVVRMAAVVPVAVRGDEVVVVCPSAVGSGPYSNSLSSTLD